jgi:hypothetical protein
MNKGRSVSGCLALLTLGTLAASAAWADNVSSSETNLERQAVDAVRALRSVVTSGVAYKDYAPRVLDARIQVDRYLQSKTGDSAVRAAVSAAMTSHELASMIWNATLGVDPDKVLYQTGADQKLVSLAQQIKNNLRIMSTCPLIETHIKIASFPFADPTTGSMLSVHMVKEKDTLLQELWGCAGQQVKIASDKMAQ